MNKWKVILLCSLFVLSLSLGAPTFTAEAAPSVSFKRQFAGVNVGGNYTGDFGLDAEFQGVTGFGKTFIGFQQMGTNGTAVKVNGSTVNDLIAARKMKGLMLYGSTLVFVGMTKTAVENVEIGTDFQWYMPKDGTTEIWPWSENPHRFTITDDELAKFVPIEGAKPIEEIRWTAENNALIETLADGSDALTVKSQPAISVKVGATTADVTGAVLSVMDWKGMTAEVPAQNYMIQSVDAATIGTGTGTVTLSYGGKTVSLTADVREAKTVESIAFAGTIPCEFGRMPVLEGLKLTVNYEDKSSSEVSLTQEMLGAFDIGDLEAQTVTLIYEGKSCSAAFQVTDSYPDAALTFDRKPAYPNVSGWYIGKFGLTATGTGMSGLKSYVGLHQLGQNGEKVLVNGITLAKYMKDNKCDGFMSYGTTLIFMGIDANKIKTVSFLPGFAWYDAAEDYYQWRSGGGAELTSDELALMTPVAGAVVKQEIRWTMENGSLIDSLADADDALTIAEKPETINVFQNATMIPVDGIKLSAKSWKGEKSTVSLKEYMVTEVLSSQTGARTATISYGGKAVTVDIVVQGKPKSMTIESSPSKTVFELGQKLDLSGMTMKVIYSDEVTKTITPTDADIAVTGFNCSELGEQTVTLTYMGVFSVTVKVTVKDSYPSLGLEFVMQVDSADIYGRYTDNFALSGDLLSNPNLNGTSYYGMDQCGNNGELCLINGKTLNQLKAEGKLLGIMLYGKKVIFAGTLKSKDVESIQFLPGFTWYESPTDFWPWGVENGEAFDTSSFLSKLTPITGATVKKYIHWIKFGDRLYKQYKLDANGAVAEDAVTVATQPAKLSYALDQPFSSKGMTLSIKYYDGTSETIDVTSDIVEKYDFSEEGQTKVRVVYRDQVFDLDVTVRNVTLAMEGSEIASNALTVTKQPDKKSYNLADRLDLTGMEVTIKFSDGQTETVDISTLAFKGFDNSRIGKQTLTADYMGGTVTVEVTVGDLDETRYIKVDSSSYAVEDTTFKGLLCVRFSFSPQFSSGTIKSLSGLQTQFNFGTHVFINGVVLTEHIAQGAIKNVKNYGSTLLFEMGSLKIEDVETIEFKRGFQWYIYHEDNFYASAPADGYDRIDGGVLKSDVHLQNMDGRRWLRPLKTDENGEVTADAIEILQYPKTQYTVGEAFDAGDMSVTVRYADGGTDTVLIYDTMINGFDPDKVGEQTLTLTYNYHTVSFKVTMNAKTAPKEDYSGCGGCGSGTDAAALLTVLALAGFAMIRRR